MKNQPLTPLICTVIGLLFGSAVLGLVNVWIAFLIHTTPEATSRQHTILFTDFIMIMVASLVAVCLLHACRGEANIRPASRPESNPDHHHSSGESTWVPVTTTWYELNSYPIEIKDSGFVVPHKYPSPENKGESNKELFTEEFGIPRKHPTFGEDLATTNPLSAIKREVVSNSSDSQEPARDSDIPDNMAPLNNAQPDKCPSTQYKDDCVTIIMPGHEDFVMIPMEQFMKDY